MSIRQPTLKPQDLLVAISLALPTDEPFSYQSLSVRLQLSTSEVHAAVKRAELSRLVLLSPKEPPAIVRGALQEFLLHGARYSFPPLQGQLTRGIVTGLAALEGAAAGAVDPEAIPPVWPHPVGKHRGYSLIPLYPTVPEACLRDPNLYEFMALLDALRLGSTREREIAVNLLQERIK